MISIDTNVLVRILVNDASSKDQTDLARDLVKQADTVLVPQVVQVETIWVLESAYSFNKEQVLSVLRLMASNPVLHLQNPEPFATAVEMFSSSNAGFADCLVLSESKNQKSELWTFDRKLGKLDGANRLTPDKLIGL